MQLSLEHGKVLIPLWKDLALKHQLCFAEYSFANNYLFREKHQYQFIENDPPYIIGQFDNGEKFTIPTLPPKANLKQAQNVLFPIPDEWLPHFKNHPHSFSENESDYLFQKQHLALLPGRHRASRRNLISQLEENHLLRAFAIGEAETPGAIQILEDWQSQIQKDKVETDYGPALEGLQKRELLGLFGYLVYADDQPAGYVLGELLTPQVALLHSAKALRQYKGMMPYLYQHFAKQLPEGVEWINLEQDLGLESLRKAKLAYEPDKMAIKWKVSAKPTPFTHSD